MDRAQARTFTMRPNSPWGVLALIGVVVVGSALLVVFLTGFLILLGVSIVAAPLLRWRLKKKLEKARREMDPDAAPRTEGARDGDPRVIDVDYTIDE